MNFFNVDGLLYKLLSRITDLLILSVLWLIFSIPVFTIGASTAAAYSITLKMVKGEESRMFKNFIKGFKTNFKQATLIWMFYLGFGLLWGYMFYLYFYGMKDIMPDFFIGILFFTALVYLMSILYVFPLTARYENSIKQTIKNSILIAFRYSFRTLQMFFVIIILVLIGIWSIYTAMFTILIGAGVIMFILSYYIRIVFDHIEANFEKEKEEKLKKSED